MDSPIRSRGYIDPQRMVTANKEVRQTHSSCLEPKPDDKATSDPEIYKSTYSAGMILHGRPEWGTRTILDIFDREPSEFFLASQLEE